MKSVTTHDGESGAMGDVQAREAVIVPDVIPIFPLAGTVLLPGEVLPLHIFEPRYRDMVRDMLAGQGVIGMVQPARGHEESLAGSPPVRPVGCAGVIAKHLELPDGRFLIWLVGLRSFRIVQELASLTPYRLVRVAEAPPDGEPKSRSGPGLRRMLLSFLPGLTEESDGSAEKLAATIEQVDDDQLIVAAVQALGLEAEERQGLLELACREDRCRAVQAMVMERVTAGGEDPLLGNRYIH